MKPGTFIEPEVNGLKDSPNGIASIDDRGLKMQILADKFRHDIFKEYDKPPTLLSIGDNIWGTAGNFSAVIGKAKSRKTFLVTIALAAISRQDDVCGISSTLPPEQGKVLFFDTEQGSYHVQQVAERLKKMANISSTELNEKLIVYKLREAENIRQRFSFIEYTINKFTDAGIVIIDGVRDLVRSINHEGEASDLVCSLMKWSSEQNNHIIAVLHTNKNDANARGHIGTELMNKSETTLLVEKHKQDDRISIVKPEFTRNLPFQDFAFLVNPYGIPIITDLPVDEQRPRRKPSSDAVSKDEYKDCVRGWENLSRVEAENAIRDYFNVGENKSKEYLAYMVKNNYVNKSKVKGMNKYLFNDI